MKETTLTCRINYQWMQDVHGHRLGVWVDGIAITHGYTITHLDESDAAALNDDGRDVTPGWWIEGDGYYFNRLHDGEDEGPLDALICHEYDIKLIELRTQVVA